MSQVLAATGSFQINVNLCAVMIGAVGVVFGDIGTSPLYSFKECFSPDHGTPFSSAAVLDIISMLFWAIVIVVSLKYMLFVMRADNNGEGGTLAPMALSLRAASTGPRHMSLLVMLDVFGVCMSYGDAVIMSVISVLSATEGLEVVAPVLSPFVLLIMTVIPATPFLAQYSGTSVVGKLPGPVMLLWFVVLAALDTMNPARAPQILVAVNPVYVISFLYDHALQVFTMLGSVPLVLTGAEALYADAGHFGIRLIR